jgi:hypothetical protein
LIALFIVSIDLALLDLSMKIRRAIFAAQPKIGIFI